jgi:hypothetical protein
LPSPSLIPKPVVNPTDLPTLTLISTATTTGTPTLTPTKIATLTRLPTSTPTQKLPSTPTVDCQVMGGEWQSLELASIGFPATLLTFRITSCVVDYIEVWSFPKRGELYVMMEAVSVPIIGNTFSYSNAEGSGSVIIDSDCTSPTLCQGTITFTKGFFFVDFSLNQEVIIPWTVSPGGQR